MTREGIIALVVVFVPWAVIALVALVRGYDITVTFTRRRGPD